MLLIYYKKFIFIRVSIDRKKTNRPPTTNKKNVFIKRKTSNLNRIKYN